MIIKVTDLETMEEIYFGDADNFLFLNNNDEELEYFLGKIERLNFGQGKKFVSYLGSEYLIEKEEDELIY